MKEFNKNETNETVVAQPYSLKRQKRNRLFLFLTFFLLLTITLYTIYTAETFVPLRNYLAQDNYLFYWMILAGCGAEIVAGSMGMGYGVILCNCFADDECRPTRYQWEYSCFRNHYLSGWEYQPF